VGGSPGIVAVKFRQTQRPKAANSQRPWQTAREGPPAQAESHRGAQATHAAEPGDLRNRSSRSRHCSSALVLDSVCATEVRLVNPDSLLPLSCRPVFAAELTGLPRSRAANGPIKRPSSGSLRLCPALLPSSSLAGHRPGNTSRGLSGGSGHQQGCRSRWRRVRDGSKATNHVAPSLLCRRHRPRQGQTCWSQAGQGLRGGRSRDCRDPSTGPHKSSRKASGKSWWWKKLALRTVTARARLEAPILQGARAQSPRCLTRSAKSREHCAASWATTLTNQLQINRARRDLPISDGGAPVRRSFEHRPALLPIGDAFSGWIAATSTVASTAGALAIFNDPLHLHQPPMGHSSRRVGEHLLANQLGEQRLLGLIA